MPTAECKYFCKILYKVWMGKERGERTLDDLLRLYTNGKLINVQGCNI